MRRRDERGATALEFGLVAPLLFMMIFGLIQYGYLFWSLTTASATAREAARRLVVGMDWQSCVEVEALTQAAQPAVGAGILVTHRYTDDDGVTLVRPAQIGDLVEVTVEFPSLYLGIPLLPVPDEGHVRQSATARVESLPPVPPTCG